MDQTHDDKLDNDRAGAINELLTAAGMALGPKFQPHMYVIHREKWENVGISEQTWHEYVATLYRQGRSCSPILEGTHSRPPSPDSNKSGNMGVGDAPMLPVRANLHHDRRRPSPTWLGRLVCH